MIYIIIGFFINLIQLQAPKEIKIISHLPAVIVEEVQPDTVADSARLAPEEVKVSYRPLAYYGLLFKQNVEMKT